MQRQRPPSPPYAGSDLDMSALYIVVIVTEYIDYAHDFMKLHSIMSKEGLESA
jgi:hypothetical protein